MNTFLKVFAGLIGIFIVVGLILPNEIKVERSVTINAPLELVHANLNNLEKWPLWSPWTAQDPTVKTVIGNIKQGVGASQTWQGASGSGQLEFLQSSLADGILYNMSFNGDSTVYKTGFSYQQSDNQLNQIKVTWFMKGEMTPIIIGNYFALLMDTLIGDSFVQGLEKLKFVSENKSA